MGKCKQEMLATLTEAEGLAIDKQFGLFTGSHHRDGFGYSCFIVPMPDDVHPVFLDIYPTVPHHLMGEIAILFNPHGVHLAAAAVIFGTPEMGIRIGENNIHTAGTHPLTRTRPLPPILLPADDVFDGMAILVAVICRCRFATVQRAGSIFMIRSEEHTSELQS